MFFFNTRQLLYKFCSCTKFAEQLFKNCVKVITILIINILLRCRFVNYLCLCRRLLWEKIKLIPSNVCVFLSGWGLVWRKSKLTFSSLWQPVERIWEILPPPPQGMQNPMWTSISCIKSSKRSKYFEWSPVILQIIET